MSRFQAIKQSAYESNMKLPMLGLVLYTFGNVSVADNTKGVFAIKPSGVAYEDLIPDEMVVVDFDGGVVEGRLRPSSDTPTHATLYKHWPEVGAIVHTHSLYGTAWAQSLRDIPIYGTTHADHLQRDIPCTPPMSDEFVSGNYEYNTGLHLINYFERKKLNYQEVEMALVGNHAPFTWGETAEKAVYNGAVLEYVAKMAALTEQINSDVSRLKDSLIKKHYNRKHGLESYYGQ